MHHEVVDMKPLCTCRLGLTYTPCRCSKNILYAALLLPLPALLPAALDLVAMTGLLKLVLGPCEFESTLDSAAYVLR